MKRVFWQSKNNNNKKKKKKKKIQTASVHDCLLISISGFLDTRMLEGGGGRFTRRIDILLLDCVA
jgi:hypothetical protein